MSATGNRAPAAILPAARGFTLIETLVVLAIAALIAGLGWPRLQGAMTAAELRGGVGAVAAGLRGARADAVRRQTPVALVVAGDTRGFRVGNAAPVTLPASVRVAALRPLLFYGDGSSSGGELVVSGARGRWRFAVTPATGLFTVAAG